jgi:hypothetical protein
MSKTKSKTKSVKSVKRGRRSMKGKWGHVGAPPKKTSWPNRPFTMATLFSRNKNQCELSLRNKVDAGVLAGTILALMPKKQPGGAVGRPKSVFVLKQYFVPSKMELSAKTVRVLRPAVTAPVVVAPAQVAVPASPAPIEAPASPAPVIVEAPAAPVETVSPAVAATPASPEPAIG